MSFIDVEHKHSFIVKFLLSRKVVFFKYSVMVMKIHSASPINSIRRAEAEQSHPAWSKPSLLCSPLTVSLIHGGGD